MEHTPFTATTASGDLVGWVSGDGPPVLALHGGPGLGFEYLDDVVAEVAVRHRVATFQQRGLPPSALEGEFTILEAVDDIVAVLDGLGWDSAYLMGHSWGGHLAFHDQLAAKEEAEGLSLDEEVEQLRLLWPSYFADPATAPAMPPIRLAQGSSEGLWGDLVTRLPELEAALPSVTVPVGVLVGAGSPMPTTAGMDTAERIPGGWCQVERGAGHFVWIESPGAVLAAMDRLTGHLG